MNFRNIGIIISREYMTRVKKKSFLVITFVVPILFVLLCTLPTLIMAMSEEKGKSVEVVDNSGIVMPYLQGSDKIICMDMTGTPVDSLKANLELGGVDAVAYISPIDSLTRNIAIEVYSVKPLTVDMKAFIKDAADEALEDYRIQSYGIPELEEIVSEVKADVKVATYTVGDDGQEKITSSEVFAVISFVLTMIIYMFVAMFSGMVISSVIEEKSSKVVEVLVSSIRSTELMFGKIIGVAAVALTQFFLWIFLAVVILVGVSTFVGFDSLMGDPAQTEQMAQMSGMDPSMLESVTSGGESEFSAILQTLKDINWGQLLFSFVVYFLLGYLLYASFFAAIGSAVDNEADTTQLQMPFTIPLLLGFMIALYAFNAPDSHLAFWGSMIPFTSPIVMLARLPFGVPAWELALSMVLLLATVIGAAWVSAKIYKVGLLVSGKKTTFKDLWKWLKQK